MGCSNEKSKVFGIGTITSSNLGINPLSPLSSPFSFTNGCDDASTSLATTALEAKIGCEWRITHINKDFKLCSTYGSGLIVPKTITDEQIIQSAAFRDGGRFPVLSYQHENGVSKTICIPYNSAIMSKWV